MEREEERLGGGIFILGRRGRGGRSRNHAHVHTATVGADYLTEEAFSSKGATEYGLYGLPRAAELNASNEI